MKKKLKIEELVHLDVPLSFTEIHHELEGSKRFPWSTEEFLVQPFIVCRNDGKLSYYFCNTDGLKWLREQAGKYDDEAYAIQQIRTYYPSIETALREEKALSREEFKDFIDKLKIFYPWIAYMWWAIEYREKRGIPFDALLEMRKYTEYFAPGCFAVFRNSAKKIYPEKIKYANVLLLSEILSDRLPSDEVLEKRLAGYAYTNNRLYDTWDDVCAEFDFEYPNEERQDLTGQVAFPGKVKGRVKIINSRKDMHTFEQGDILVASTTTPDLLPIMKISGAIVSEHGGVISHAAVTSRELKIPCVVGVKKATQLLKNGDLVEVDANTGIVKVIK